MLQNIIVSIPLAQSLDNDALKAVFTSYSKTYEAFIERVYTEEKLVEFINTDASEEEILQFISEHISGDVELQRAQQQKINEIDRNTDEIYSRGMTYNDSLVYFDTNSQINYITIEVLKEKPFMSFPRQIPTRTGPSIVLHNAEDLDNFMQALVTYKETIVYAGAVLKAQVLATTTVEQVNSIVDSRM